MLLFSRQNQNQEKGAIIVLMAIMLFGVLMVSGLFLDTTKVTRAKQKLQKAADAALYATLLNRVLNGNPVNGTNISGECKQGGTSSVSLDHHQRGLLVAESNIISAKLDKDEANLQVCFDYTGATPGTNPNDGNDETVRVDIDYPVDLMLLDALPVFGGTSINTEKETVRVSAEGSLQRANVVLVLDVSNSMGCPGTRDGILNRGGGGCDCSPKVFDDAIGRSQCTKIVDCVQGRDAGAECQAAIDAYTPGITPGGVDNRKIQDLIAAVNTFVARFNPQRDRIALVAYNITSSVLVPFNSAPVNSASGRVWFDPDAFTAALNSGNFSNPRSLSNPSDGLISAYQTARGAGIFGSERISYVLFSDGAPTAGRFLFANPSGLPANNILGGSEADHDYIHYEVLWHPPLDFDGSLAFRGPSQLIQSGSVAFGVLPEDMEDAVGGEAAFRAVSCGTTSNDTNAGTRQSQAFSCLSDLGFNTPAGATPSKTIPVGSLSDYKKTYYDAVFTMADFLRKNKGHVYTIGIGPAAGGASAYEDVNDDFSRKDQLLSRTAFARQFDSNREFDLGDTSATHLSDQPPGLDWSGEYENSQDPADLPILFNRIAKKILIRLVK